MRRREAQRILGVATALRQSPNPEHFTMRQYGIDCGSPCCALGHYAVRTDLQQKFSLDSEGDLMYRRGHGHGSSNWADYSDEEVLDYFGITEDECNELFSGIGCNQARTAVKAAEYIENFLDEKGWSF